MSIAIANQLLLAYLGRPGDLQWRASTANLLNDGQPSLALQRAFYDAAVAEGVFDPNDSSLGLVNKIFQQIFGFSASSYEQSAWANLINNGTISVATAAWTIFSSYLGATNVPDAYKLPAQSKLIAINAYTDQLANNAAANLALSQGGSAAAAARSFTSGVIDQATAAQAAGGIVAAVAVIIPTVRNLSDLPAPSTEPAGPDFTLTLGADTFTGGTVANTFTALDVAVSGTPTATFSLNDRLDGGAGADTLTVTTAAAFAGVPAGASVTNIETVAITSTGGGVTLDTTAGFAGLTSLTASAVARLAVTAATATDVTATVTGASATDRGIVVNGGRNIDLTVSGTVTAGGGGDPEIVVGSTAAPATGTVRVASSLAGPNFAQASWIEVNGGTTVEVVQTLQNAVNTVNQHGRVRVNGTAQTTSVTVTQDPASSASTSVAGKTNSDVRIIDLNQSSATAPGSIATVTATNFGTLTVETGALRTLNLSGTGGSVTAFSLGSLTTPASTVLDVNIAGLTLSSGMSLDSDITTLNITATGAASTLSSIPSGAVLTLNVAGTAALTFAQSNMSGLAAVNVTNTAGFSLPEAILTGTIFTGGDGNDAVILRDAFTRTIAMGGGNDTVTYGGPAGTGGLAEGGLGTDTIVMTSAQLAAITASGASGDTFRAAFRGFEALRLTGTADGDTVNVNFAQLNGIGENAIDAVSIAIPDTTFPFGAQATVRTLTLEAAAATTVSVSGNNGLTLTNTGNVAITRFDASGVVANSNGTFTFSGGAFVFGTDDPAGLAVTFASANAAVGAAVTIIGGAGHDVLTGNLADDTISGGGGADNLTGADGTDTFVYTTLAHSLAATADRITDFTAGTDKLDVTTVPLTLLQGAAYTAVGTGALATDISAALTAGGDTLTAGTAAAVVSITGTGVGTYVIINDGTVGYQGESDAVINITGLVGTLALADFV